MDSEEFKQLRRKMMLTQKELAKIMEVNPITISEWERGARNIGLRNQRKIIELCKKNNIEI